MSEDIEKLKHDYRDIVAPAHLATRIRAQVAERPARVSRWIPVTASVLVAVTAVWFLPVVLQQQAVQVPATSKPSLSTLARLKPVKPQVAAPSLSKVRSVRVPSMPRKPDMKLPVQPRSHIEFEIEDPEEKNHA